jgi:hypothetical protein
MAAYTLSKIDVWAGTLEDRPGGLAEKLEALAVAGVNLEFIIARRQPDQPGTGVVFLAPVSGSKEIRAAKAAGLAKADHMFGLRLEGPDKQGMGAKVTRALAQAGVNLRGISAAALNRKFVTYFSFDSKEDSAKAMKTIKAELKI